MMEITEDNVRKQILLLGNEAIARGALEAGVDVATTYPGTPSSEIGDTFSKIAKQATKQNKNPGFYFEYSTNEKVALEIAAAASFCGLRALTCMKHVGLNVASDVLMTYLYMGCKGGHIIVSADDPYCHSSQNEQDNRYFALFSNAPMLEPITPQEAKEMTRIGFDISEELRLPILLRTTTRLNHARGPVNLSKLQKPRATGQFEKDPLLVSTSVTARIKHPVLLKKMEQAEKISEKSPFNTILNIGKPTDKGIVTSGISVNYCKEVAEALKLNVKILKLGMTHPIPRKMCEQFIKSCNIIVVVEELEPILEQQFKALAHAVKSDVRIYGKSTGHLSRLYEYTPDVIADAFSKIFNVKNPFLRPVQLKLKLPSRPPTLCPGCSHRATFYAVKKAAPKGTVYPTDIGCYVLGKASPIEVGDLLFCMGSNAGTACGLAVSTNQKIVSFMGDSTFFHSGIPPIIDAVHHNHDVVITILDNRTTAMTGHQPHPGTEYDGMGRLAKLIKVEDIVKGLGVEHIEIVDPNNIKETVAAFKRALDFKGPSVVISISPCILPEIQRKSMEENAVYHIDQEKCNQCKICIDEFGCPALYYAKDGITYVDETLCSGCGNCAEICPFDAIYIKGGKNDR
ncbi:MAG: indolepyruvate ferredoxin oxidoreductase subunit alpha [Thermoplasmatales archaeon]|nr:MAG: indolepyruvate ferredoxin oxidoreductase subunit alpha [Thermoplasmatales archaeon]